MLNCQRVLWKPQRCCVSSLSVKFEGHSRLCGCGAIVGSSQWGRHKAAQPLAATPSVLFSPIVNLYRQKTSSGALCEGSPPWIPPCSTFQVWISHYREDKAGVLSHVNRDPSPKYMAQSLCCNLVLTEAVYFLPRCVPAHSLF